MVYFDLIHRDSFLFLFIYFVELCRMIFCFAFLHNFERSSVRFTFFFVQFEKKRANVENIFKWNKRVIDAINFFFTSVSRAKREDRGAISADSHKWLWLLCKCTFDVIFFLSIAMPKWSKKTKNESKQKLAQQTTFQVEQMAINDLCKIFSCWAFKLFSNFYRLGRWNAFSLFSLKTIIGKSFSKDWSESKMLKCSSIPHQFHPKILF